MQGLWKRAVKLTDRQLGDEWRWYYRLPPQGRRAAEGGVQKTGSSGAVREVLSHYCLSLGGRVSLVKTSLLIYRFLLRVPRGGPPA